MTLLAEIDTEDNQKIVIDQFEWRFKDLLKSLPSSKYKDDKWFFNLSWQMCLALKYTFKEHLEVGPNLKAWADQKYQTSILPAYNLRTAPDAEGYPQLFPHQRADVKFLSAAGRAILANGMGSGKSQSSFSAVRYLYEQGKDVFPVLITCPNSTKGSWKREIEKVWPGLTVHIVDGSAAKRRKILEQPGHVYIINWEGVRGHSRLAPFGSIALKKCPEHKGLDDRVKPTACEVHEKELNKIDFKTVIGDEIHRIKDPSSKMSRAFKAATGNADYRFALSGTPIASSPDDLYSVLNWLYPEAYPSKSKYLDRFCETHFNAWGATVVVGIKKSMEQEFFAGLDPILRRMPKEAILPFLPPVIRERRDVEMGAKQKKAYEQMRDQMIAELGDNILHTTSPLVKMTRLIQFASAYADVEIKDVYNKKKGVVEKKALVTLADPSCKIDAFMDDLDDFGDESIIVFAASVQLIRMLSARLEKLKIPHGLITGDQDSVEREKHMENFQAGKTKLILCTIQAGGTGITLTRAKIMVYLQRSWSMIDNLQSEARGHRIGSEIHDHVEIIDYVTAGTVEEEVFRAIEQKSNNLEAILRDKDLMKKVLENKPVEIETEVFDIDKARTEKSEYDEE